MNAKKPVATYTPHEQQEIVVGRPAYVFGVSHYNPSIKGALVRTSTVLRKEEDGEFETRNTIYKAENPPAPTS